MSLPLDTFHDISSLPSTTSYIIVPPSEDIVPAKLFLGNFLQFFYYAFDFGLTTFIRPFYHFSPSR